MADKSTFQAIIVAVAIALIAGGSAPWWWGRIFPDAKGIGVCASGASPSNEFHDAPAANGSWDWNCNGKIEHEWGPCENLTREQCDPHTNATGASPGFCTQLRSEGGCPPTISECGEPGYIYPCFYNSQDGRCHAGGYESAQTMRCQ